MRHAAFAAAFCLACITAPAAGQIAERPNYGDVPRVSPLGPDGRLPRAHPAREARELRGDIRRLRESGSISSREARQLSREARLIARHGRGEISYSAARAMEGQVLALRSRIYAAQSQPSARGRRR